MADILASLKAVVLSACKDFDTPDPECEVINLATARHPEDPAIKALVEAYKLLMENQFPGMMTKCLEAHAERSRLLAKARSLLAESTLIKMAKAKTSFDPVYGSNAFETLVNHLCARMGGGRIIGPFVFRQNLSLNIREVDPLCELLVRGLSVHTGRIDVSVFRPSFDGTPYDRLSDTIWLTSTAEEIAMALLTSHKDDLQTYMEDLKKADVPAAPVAPPPVAEEVPPTRSAARATTTRTDSNGDQPASRGPTPREFRQNAGAGGVREERVPSTGQSSSGTGPSTYQNRATGMPQTAPRRVTVMRNAAADRRAHQRVDDDSDDEPTTRTNGRRDDDSE